MARPARSRWAPSQVKPHPALAKPVDCHPTARHAPRPSFPRTGAPTPRNAPVSESTPSVPPANTWEAILDTLRRRYPGQKDSVLFCIYKLQQNPDLTMRDFKQEADLHQIPTAGRALHSARVILGLLKPTAPAPAPAPAETAAEGASRRRRSRMSGDDDGGASIESKVIAAVRQIQSSAGAEADQLRAAVRQAIALLQRALGD